MKYQWNFNWMKFCCFFKRNAMKAEAIFSSVRNLKFKKIFMTSICNCDQIIYRCNFKKINYYETDRESTKNMYTYS